MAKEMTREEKLWTMTETTLLGVAEGLGLNVNKNTLKQGKEKLIAKILEAEKKLENGANNEQIEAPEMAAPVAEEKPKRRRGKNKASEEVAGDGAPYSQVMNEIFEDEKKAAKKKTESKASKAPKKDPKKANLKMNELTYKGQTKTVREWADQIGMPWATLYDRVNRNGWTVEDAIEIPLGERRPK